VDSVPNSSQVWHALVQTFYLPSRSGKFRSSRTFCTGSRICHRNQYTPIPRTDNLWLFIIISPQGSLI